MSNEPSVRVDAWMSSHEGVGRYAPLAWGAIADEWPRGGRGSAELRRSAMAGLFAFLGLDLGPEAGRVRETEDEVLP